MGPDLSQMFDLLLEVLIGLLQPQCGFEVGQRSVSIPSGKQLISKPDSEGFHVGKAA
jgi:hypothetical protein